ncbi:hypothetical protein R3X27_24465 [Tropicimonas sp. TH_r6]|uniref:hypothetical protein n=1 Tax=Tropicimonas sp. TH_r6 TaxID=3082085 RepID=UPI0029533264|nr:hypothetical protein [Tropicimonas sp. TH_r6]MDV7145845.1 hypothetical protein [Tropicimonas sp. TH_r6]
MLPQVQRAASVKKGSSLSFAAEGTKARFEAEPSFIAWWISVGTADLADLRPIIASNRYLRIPDFRALAALSRCSKGSGSEAGPQPTFIALAVRVSFGELLRHWPAFVPS